MVCFTCFPWQLDCCGIDGPEDFDDLVNGTWNRYYRLSNGVVRAKVPPTCCRVDNLEPGKVLPNGEWDTLQFTDLRGCLTTASDDTTRTMVGGRRTGKSCVCVCVCGGGGGGKSGACTCMICVNMTLNNPIACHRQTQQISETYRVPLAVMLPVPFSPDIMDTMAIQVSYCYISMISNLITLHCRYFSVETLCCLSITFT